MMMPFTPLWLEKVQHTPLNAFCDGNAAVILLFVLSGLVLNLKYTSFHTLPPRRVPVFFINRSFGFIRHFSWPSSLVYCSGTSCTSR